MNIASLTAAGAVALLSLAAVAYAGQPLQGIPVGLDHDPEGIAVPGGKTDAKGNASFTGLKAGKGKGYAMDKAGRKLVFTLDKPGTPFVVTISDR